MPTCLRPMEKKKQYSTESVHAVGFPLFVHYLKNTRPQLHPWIQKANSTDGPWQGEDGNSQMTVSTSYTMFFFKGGCEACPNPGCDSHSNSLPTNIIYDSPVASQFAPGDDSFYMEELFCARCKYPMNVLTPSFSRTSASRLTTHEFSCLSDAFNLA
jgi:hypothetical protein